MVIGALLVLSGMHVLPVESVRRAFPIKVRLRPDEMAENLVHVESRWLSQAASFAECNSTTDARACTGTSEAFVASCGLIVGAVMHASKDDHAAAAEYMENVCSATVLTGWYKDRCQSLSLFLGGALLAEETLGMRHTVVPEDLCRAFWPQFFSEATDLIPAVALDTATAIVKTVKDDTAQVKALTKAAGQKPDSKQGVPRPDDNSHVVLFQTALESESSAAITYPDPDQVVPALESRERLKETSWGWETQSDVLVAVPWRQTGGFDRLGLCRRRLKEAFSALLRWQGPSRAQLVLALAFGFALYISMVSVRTFAFSMQKQPQNKISEPPAKFDFEEIILQKERFSGPTDSYTAMLRDKFTEKMLGLHDAPGPSITEKMVFEKMLRAHQTRGGAGANYVKKTKEHAEQGTSSVPRDTLWISPFHILSRMMRTEGLFALAKGKGGISPPADASADSSASAASQGLDVVPALFGDILMLGDARATLARCDSHSGRLITV